MTREIKFRLFDGEKMCPVGSIEFFEGGGMNINDEFPSTGKDPYPFMQFTGLKDCKGVEIYEGDLVRREDESGSHIVEYRVDSGTLYYGPYFLKKDSLVEVIGNIYENPNLINGDK